MKKFLIIIVFFSFCLSGCGNNDNSIDNQEENNYTATRAASLDNTNETNTTTNSTYNNMPNAESELSSFSTKIYTPNDKARQNNIRITCSKLDGTVVKSRRDFFFLQYCR